MKKTLSGIALFSMLIVSALAQTPANSTLFNIGNEKVSTDEFVKVYQKTNVSGEADFSEKSLRDYLDLYVNFRLKVKEAKELKMDTTAEVINEFKTYRGKLTPAYMFDTSLIRLAYKRMQTELHVEHILVKIDANASPADTMKAYKRIMNFSKILAAKKIAFSQMAADSSDDPSAKDNKGDLGWISSMQVIYPFETAAYSQKVGVIGKPVRTTFGYHIIRVIETRPAQGMVTAAHIFIKTTQSNTPEEQEKAKAKIDSLYGLLKSGANFEELAKTYSQDKTSSAQGGQLKQFGTGQMVPEFESAAFALKNNGDYSSPVHTKYGWHIIKLIDKKSMGSYDSMKDEIKKKIEGGPWKDYSKQSFVAKLKKEYQYKEFNDKKMLLFSKIDSTILKGVWNDSLVTKMNDAVFTLTDTKWAPEKKSFTQSDLADFIEKNQRKAMGKGVSKDIMLRNLFDQYAAASITNFEDVRLEAKYPPFRDLMEEYMNGILLFDLASEKVWTKAVEDTSGLNVYYEKNKNQYMGQEKARTTIYSCKNQSVADMLIKYQNKKMSNDAILAKVNKKDKSNLQIETHDFEKGKESEIEKLGWEAGKSYTVKGDSGIRILHIDQILAPAPKPLNEVKGYVVADYQEYLEKEWIAELRKKYPVTINEQAFKSMVKK